MTAEICLCSWMDHVSPCHGLWGWVLHGRARIKDAGMCPVATIALKVLVKCIMREGPPKCRSSASTSSGAGALLEASDSMALATSPVAL